MELTNSIKHLETLLAGEIPPIPPHFELVFQLEEEYFKMSWDDILNKNYASESQKADAITKFHADVYLQVLERFGWAALPAPGGGEIDFAKGIEYMKKVCGDKALLFSFSMDGVYWMPSGSEIMDFVDHHHF